MKNLVFVLGVVFSSFHSFSQPTLCAFEAIDMIEAQGGIMVGESFQWIALGDDHFIKGPGLDLINNIELYVNGSLIPNGGAFDAGDLLRIDGISIGSDPCISNGGTDCKSHPVTEIIVSAALPVTWLKPTTAEIRNNKSMISFSTAQQINNLHFEIEHSQDRRTYQTIGKIEGEDNSNREIDYQFIHDAPSFGIIHYRVKQIDLDGQYSYSNVASVIYRTDEVNVYPNPVGDLLTVSLPNESSVSIYNHLGQQIGKYEFAEGENTVDLSSMESGLYFLKFDDGTMKRVVKR